MKILVILIALLSLSNISLSKKNVKKTLRTHHSCDRLCIKGQNKFCQYKFEVESYFTMNRACKDCPRNITDCYNTYCLPADGVPRAVVVINKQLPGPLIKVCKGDTIVVDVTNGLPSDTTSIHWHGILQERTQYNDGVPFVTQCPIVPGETFRYQFKATEAGTFFYHSHVGLQRVDGVTGPLIVKEPLAENSLIKLYDFDLDEHVIVYFDWDHELGLSKYEGVLHWVNGSNAPYSMLINGLGRNKTYVGLNNENVFTPTARFHVENGKRYRFRLINSGNLDCPIQVSIDGHNLTVISSDANDFAPVEVESIVTYAGERYDFILNANKTPDVYWMKFRGLLQCSEEYNSVRQVAVLQYDGVPNDTYPPGNPTYEETDREGLQLNPLNEGSSDPGTITLPELKAIDPVQSDLKAKPTFVYFMPYDLNLIYNPDFLTDEYPTPQINHITSKNLPFPLLSQRNDLDDSMFCNEKTVSNCEQTYCKCSYLVKIPLNSLVELILINEARVFKVNHPFHLHGYKFRVVSTGVINTNSTTEDVKTLYKGDKIKKNLINAPWKDTVGAPVGGYTIIRFKATNPGFWLMHCHVEHHIEEGMFLVFQVGTHKQMPPVPEDFPACGNYKPKLKLCR